MNSNKIDRFICEIKTYGDDITFDIRMGSIVFSSKKTNFKNIEEDLLTTASYYGLTIGLLSQNTCEFYEKNNNESWYNKEETTNDNLNKQTIIQTFKQQ